MKRKFVKSNITRKVVVIFESLKYTEHFFSDYIYSY